MAIRLLIVLLIATAIAGCSSWRSKPAQPVANTAAVPAQAAPPAASQSSSYMQVPGSYAVGGVPPMEANREINTQDCGQEVDLTAGNLNCR
ncbi:MAG TPA: hypothetical protein VE085_04945 [Burkholderiales bacterium]|nr:hypothetical protein [Burkholderiales bacterium]